MFAEWGNTFSLQDLFNLSKNLKDLFYATVKQFSIRLLSRDIGNSTLDLIYVWLQFLGSPA